jgi:hypothetical protein
MKVLHASYSLPQIALVLLQTDIILDGVPKSNLTYLQSLNRIGLGVSRGRRDSTTPQRSAVTYVRLRTPRDVTRALARQLKSYPNIPLHIVQLDKS